MTTRHQDSYPCYPCAHPAGPDLPGACPCQHDHDDHDVDLPADAFVALRVASGMLLGEDDFRVLMGNPRGKHRLHAAWLHGRGVVWGMQVRHEAPGWLRVEPGLAVDGAGRELRLEAAQCLDLLAWATAPGRDRERDRDQPGTACGWTVETWVVAQFAACPDRPVPALADPCDVSRRHDSYSRVVETMRLTLTPDPPPADPPYPRLRKLLGLDEPDPRTDGDVLEALRQVRRTAPNHRAAVLQNAFRHLAARDVHQLRPREWTTREDDVPRLPVAGSEAGVVLARVSFTLYQDESGGRVEDVRVDPSEPHCPQPESLPPQSLWPEPPPPASLLPVSLLQDLLCGAACGVPGLNTEHDACGPRLDPDSVGWSEDATSVNVTFDRPVLPGSWEGAVEVTSLSPDGRGWSPAHIDVVKLVAAGDRDEDQHRCLVVHLDAAPAYSLTRLLIRGTGPTPLVGADPRVPFAGTIGGPAGSAHQGHDAAVMTDLLVPGRSW